MNLNQIQYFITLAQMEHYTQAAKLLCITQPSLSHAITMLEKELGVPLFEKQGRNVVLTKYGKEFYKYAKASQDILDNGVRKMNEMSGVVAGYISIGYIPTQGSSFVPKVVKGFLEQYPEKKVRFSFQDAVTKKVVEGLKDETFDVIFSSKVENEKEITFLPVSEEQLVAVVPKGHPLSNRESLSVEEIGIYPQICFPPSSGLHFVILELFEKHHIVPEIVYEIAEDSSMAGMVAQGFGVAIMPDVPVLKYLEVERIPLENLDVKRYIYMGIMKGRYQTPIVEEFIRYVQEQYQITS